MIPLSQRLVQLTQFDPSENHVADLLAAARAALAWEICHTYHWMPWFNGTAWIACLCEDGAAVVPLAPKDTRQSYPHPVTAVLEAKKILDQTGEA